MSDLIDEDIETVLLQSKLIDLYPTKIEEEIIPAPQVPVIIRIPQGSRVYTTVKGIARNVIRSFNPTSSGCASCQMRKGPTKLIRK